MIKVDKYTNIDRGADQNKEYYINQDGRYLSLSKVELEKIACDLNLLGIVNVVGQSEQLCEHPMSERADIVGSRITYCLKCSTTL